MSSKRFPGKVLAPFRGEPLIMHVFRRVGRVLPASDIVVTTSNEASDEPLVSYLRGAGVLVFRGPLDNVFERFRLCLKEHPCDWILRISADSPLLDIHILRLVIGKAEENDCDLVSTIFPRTLPSGLNAELIRSSAFISVPSSELTREDQEHVTPYFYRHSNQYRIRNVETGSYQVPGMSLAVDSVEDLRRIEGLAVDDADYADKSLSSAVSPPNQ